MCSNELQNFNFENYKMINKLNDMFLKLLCIDNFYDALDYIVLELGEIFNIEGIFVVEVLENKNLAIYRLYNQGQCINIRKEKLNKLKILENLALNEFLFIEDGRKERLIVFFDFIKDIKNQNYFLKYKQVIRKVLTSLYKRNLKEVELRKKSFYDTLTGCYNRNFFELKMKEYSSAVRIGIIVCDMDRLKEVNDTLGHTFGDDIIKIFVEKLKENIEKDDFIFRVGGDEFVIMTKGKNDDYLQKLVFRIKESFKYHNKEKNNFPISISIGYSMKNKCEEGIKDILKIADYLMYQDKIKHRDKYDLEINNYIEFINHMKRKIF